MVIILRTFLHFLNSRSNSLYWAYILKWYIFKNNLSVAISKYTLKYNMCRPGSNWYKISSIRITQSVFRKRTFMSRKLLVWRHISNPCCYRDLLHSVLGDDIHVGLSKWWELLCALGTKEDGHYLSIFYLLLSIYSQAIIQSIQFVVRKFGQLYQTN